jgi:glutaminyl-tRNA synthetase
MPDSPALPTTPAPTSTSSPSPAPETPVLTNFLREQIAEDYRSKRFGDAIIQTRFPPEPNGYLHIGHAKAICLDFGLAQEFGGKTNLRFDDTNPQKEEQEYVDSIMEDVRWLGFQWDRLCYASDYFQQLYDWALKLVHAGKAYVDDLSADQIRHHRGTLTEPGTDSPFRSRSIEENLDLFTRMKAGEFPDGSRVLRAKIDMASPNLNMRDPVMYRILRSTHHRTGDDWCIYPMYDYAHGQSDSIERVTHSMCTLEFADHQPLYRWYIEQLGIFPSQQFEFDRLNITYTMLSKRKLLQLVQENRVNGWDDPRMPTLSGLRRRGFTPEAIRTFVAAAGVSRTNGSTDFEMLEHFQRDDLNRRARRAMAVLNPLKLIIDNYPVGPNPEDPNNDLTEYVEVANNPEDPSAGTRSVPFSREIYIDHDDFREVPPPKYYRLSPGKEVRLRNAYFVTAQSIVKDDAGNIIEVHCTYDPLSRGGNSPDGRKVKSTIHWVSCAHAISAEIRIYDKLFSKPNPADLEVGPDGHPVGDVLDNLNPNSLQILTTAKLEPSLASAAPGTHFQFERVGYFCVDPDSSSSPDSPSAPDSGTYPSTGHLVFNRTLPLKDSWAKIEKKSGV